MKRFLPGIALLLSTVNLPAQQGVNPELKKIIEQSFTYFPRFKELEQTAKINEQRIGWAATGNKPNISANAEYSYINPVGTIEFPSGGVDKKFQIQPNHNFNSYVSVSVPIYDFGRTKLDIERAKDDLKQSKNNIEFNKAQLAAQVAGIYYTIIYLQKAIAVEDSVIAVLQENKRFVESKYKNGDALKIDVLTWDNNIDIEQNRKVDLQNSLQKQFNLLSYATGLDSSAVGTQRFDFAVSSLTAGDALKAAQSNNFEYIMAQQRIKQAETEVALARMNLKPTIRFNGSTGFRNGYVPDLGIIRYNYMLGLGVRMPVYSAGRLKKQVQIAQSGVTQTQLALSSMDNQLKKDIRQAYADIRSNGERLRNTEEQISIAKEVLRLAQSRYNNGVGNHVDLLNANSNLQKIELAQLQYQYQLTLANIELARLMGIVYW